MLVKIIFLAILFLSPLCSANSAVISRLAPRIQELDYDVPSDLESSFSSRRRFVPRQVVVMAQSKKYQALYKSGKSIRMSFDKSQSLDHNGMTLESDVSRAFSKPDFLVTIKPKTCACRPVKLGWGLGLTPLEAAACPVWLGAKFCKTYKPSDPCTCYYFCGKFGFVKYCGYFCPCKNKPFIAGWFGWAFTCKVTGIPVPLPLKPVCPLRKQQLCCV